MVGRVARVFFIVAVMAVLGACSPSAIAAVSPIASSPLVTVTMRGGECPEGMCEAMVVIERDGRIHRVAPAAGDVGIAPANVIATLHTAVQTTDFDAIRARPFTGTCPVAYDGQEIVYEFGAPGGVQRIASCETNIDSDAPLFAAVTAALQAVGSAPAG